MRQIWITKAGAPEVLAVREAADPEPKSGEVRVRVRAAGINFADLLARQGLYPDAPKIPCVVGYEVSGVVDAIGKDVTRVAIGDRVMAMPRFGGYTDTLVVDEAQAVKLPEKMTFEEAAALPVVYLTAHHMMLFTGHLRPRSKVLIHSAAGGVGLAALQIGKTRDCEMFGIASKGKHDFLRERGCAHPIDSNEDYVEAVRKISPSGVDLVLDPAGGKHWEKGYDLLAPAGRLVAFGFSAATTKKTRSVIDLVSWWFGVPKWSPIDLMDKNRAVAGTNMGHLFGELEMLRSQLEALLAMYERGEIAPHVDKTFPFSEAAAAHHYIHDRRSKGKVLLVPDA